MQNSSGQSPRPGSENKGREKQGKESHNEGHNWHKMQSAAVLEQLESSPQGLSAETARKRLAQYGPNRLKEGRGRSALTRFLLQFHNVLIYVLLAAAAVTALLDHLIDTLVILAVVLANAAIGFIQEGKAEKAMQAIRQMLAPNAAVLRQGQRHSVPGQDLVPGDVVLLEAGDKVPADLRLLQTKSLQIQEAILTGESVPVEKGSAPVPAQAALGDRNCMAFSGTLVTSGMGRGVVVATGEATEVGRISGLLSEVEVLTTPLVQQMDVFGRYLTVVILLVGAALLAFGYFVGDYAFAELFMVVVGLSVAAIPEGLPAVLTITLAIGVQAMARRNAIVRRLPAIETLGSVSVICSDKTGTLTRNEMMVAKLALAGQVFAVSGAGYAPHGEIRQAEQVNEDDCQPLLQEMGQAAALCNDARLHEREGVWTVEGNPMEGALLALAGKTGVQLDPAQSDCERIDAIPFDARLRYMATLNRGREGQGLIVVKGAPERILAMCELQRAANGGSEALQLAHWQQQAEDIAAEGLRVLAFAIRQEAGQRELAEADVETGLCLLGLTGLIDPPRDEAVEAVAQCHSAGIRVKMITGDHAGTARAIGRQIGLQNGDAVLTGAEIESMDEAALAAAVVDTDVFARTSPEHKLRLVMALQAHGLTVAMTGDGVNDAPALKRADAGIAMGQKGSEAAKEASELVLADDNFASIAAAVREGRTVYDNIKKVISWTLPTNAGEAMTIIAALLLGLSLPITPIQILWVNLITGVTLGLALAFEPTEENTMRRPPRPRDQPILSGLLVWQILLASILFAGGVFGVYFYALDAGRSLELARTLSLNTLVVMEIFYLFFIRNVYGTSLTWRAVRGTRVVWITVILVTLAQLAMTYLAPLQAVFGTQAVPLMDGLLVLGIGVALLIIIEAEKQVRLRLLDRRG